MAWGAVAMGMLSMYGSYMGAQASKRGSIAQANEYRRIARDTLLTAKYNTKERNKAAFQTQLNLFESAGQESGYLANEGQRRKGSQEVQLGASGAVMGEGTALDVLMNQALQDAQQQMGVQDKTEAGFKSIARNTNAANRTEMRAAKLKQRQLYRQANLTEQGADASMFSNLLSGMVQGFQVGSSGSSDWSLSDEKDNWQFKY
jgi:hypothetical protein